MAQNDGYDGVHQRARLERGTVVSIGAQPTIRCHGSGNIVSFAYRVVKRRSSERRHHFQVGDVVQYRLSPHHGNAADGSAISKAEQVWVLSPIRTAPSAVVGTPMPIQAVNTVPEAQPAPVPWAAPPVRCWRHDPYSSTSSVVTIDQ
eukprot:TRINITY_DN2055_c0_g1_i1.p2 TRINITY_DN2055_c0_g1~~TRINITY_DN2055_c0_g1_i1.p2  ORF type:complete len:147 (+),score=24.95 TRINITY_DN2055_c0_g1_i1:119-559(+)